MLTRVEFSSFARVATSLAHKHMGFAKGRPTRLSRSDAKRVLPRMARGAGLLVVVLLAGCQSAQEAYLAKATGHATVAEVEQVLGAPIYAQALDAGQRRLLYRWEGEGTGGRDFIPYCQDFWLTFDREGVLHRWEKQRC